MADRLKSTLPILIPSVVLVLHVLMFGTWIIDDAAISFSYARSLAEGHGLTAQAGVPPVEGFSNFLWTILFVPLIALGVFDPAITPKVISLICMIGAFALLAKSVERAPRGSWIAGIALTLTALHPSFAIWTAGGLENPLYVLGISGLVYGTSQAVYAVRLTHRGAALMAVMAGAVALTRPDGLVYMAAYPAALIAMQITLRRWGIKPVQRHLLIYAAVFVGIYGAFLSFRWLYYGALVPNTYYAKDSDIGFMLLAALTLQIEALLKISDLMFGTLGRGGNLLAFGLLILGVVFTIRRWLRRDEFVIALFALTAMLVFVLLPLDWMREYRFATPFFPLFFLLVVMLATHLIEMLPLRGSQRFLLIGAIGVFIASVAVAGYRRSAAFAAAPEVPFQVVAEHGGERFNQYANMLGLEDASVLLPDVGGTLWVSRLRVYDLYGLTDPTIARTLGIDQPAFYDYLFEAAQPTFITIHGFHTDRARLDTDPRFRRDYVAICEYIDAWVRERHGYEMYSGTYIRKDVVQGGSEALTMLQQAATCP